MLGRLSSSGRLGNFNRKVLVAVHSEREVGLERAKIIGRSTCLAISLITSSENRSLTALNPKIKNLVYAGQLTVPGPGVPPSLISGKLAAELSLKHFKNLYHAESL